MPTSSAPSGVLADLPELDPNTPEFIADPQSILGPLRARHELARSPRGIEVLSYRLCSEILKDPNVVLGIDTLFEASGVTEGPAHEFAKHMTLNIEGAEHRRVRKAIAPAFLPERFESLRGQLRELIEDRLDQIGASNEFDFQEDFAKWVSGVAFCLFAGESVEMADTVFDISGRAQLWYKADPQYRDMTIQAYDEAFRWVDELIAARRANPGDDVLSAFLHAADAGHLSEEELRIHFVTTMTASTHTTSGQIAMSVSALADRPDQWQLLREDPSLVAGAAVETSRWRPGGWTIWRSAVNGTSHGGYDFPPGTMFAIDVISANHDPAIWENPGQLDIRREQPRPPLQWSIGRHFCLGRVFALLQIEEILAAMAKRWKEFEVPPFELSGAPVEVSPETMTVRFTNA